MKTLSSALLCLCALSACSNTDCTPTGGVEDRAVSSIDCAPQELCYRGSCRDSCNAAGASCKADSDCPGVRPNCVDSPTGKVCSSCEHEQYCVGSLHVCVDFTTPADPTPASSSGGTIPESADPSEGGSTDYAEPSVTPRGPEAYPESPLGIETIAQLSVEVNRGAARGLSQHGFAVDAVQTATTGWEIDPDGSLWQVELTPYSGNTACYLLRRSAVADAAELELAAPELRVFSSDGGNSTPVSANTVLASSDAETTYSLDLEGNYGDHGGGWTAQRGIPSEPALTLSIGKGLSIFTWDVPLALPSQYVQLVLKTDEGLIRCTSLADHTIHGDFRFPSSRVPSGRAQLYSFNQARVTGTDDSLFLLLRVRTSTTPLEF